MTVRARAQFTAVEWMLIMHALHRLQDDSPGAAMGVRAGVVWHKCQLLADADGRFGRVTAVTR